MKDPESAKGTSAHLRLESAAGRVAGAAAVTNDVAHEPVWLPLVTETATLTKELAVEPAGKTAFAAPSTFAVDEATKAPVEYTLLVTTLAPETVAMVAVTLLPITG
jgi:hypothetical protein